MESEIVVPDLEDYLRPGEKICILPRRAGAAQDPKYSTHRLGHIGSCHPVNILVTTLLL